MTRGRLLVGLVLLALVPATTRAQSDTAVREGFVDVAPGVSLHYFEAGRRSASLALVLIPGWRLPATLWLPQVRKLSSTMRVIAIDPRSQGQSTQTVDGNTPERRARDLHEALAKLGIARVVLTGWSQGAQDVAAYVQQFGVDSIAGVVFVDSPVSFGADEVQAHPQMVKGVLANTAVYAEHPTEFSEGMVRSLFAKPHPELDMPGLIRATQQTPTATGIAMLVADLFGADRRPALARLSNVPTLVLAASTSPLLEQQRAMAASIPGAKFVVVEGAGHALFIDAPDVFHAAMLALVRSARAA
jgi:microsomal epoxide hydrolase